MQLSFYVTAAALVTLLCAPTPASTPLRPSDDVQANVMCRCEMHALVAYLKETAQLEGDCLSIEWHPDGSATVCNSGFCQHIRCKGDEMHIDFSDTPAPLPD